MLNEHGNPDVVEASSSNDRAGHNEGGPSTSHTSESTRRGHVKRRRCNQELETCAEVLARRQKQIDYGKNTIGYDNYIKQIPRNKRTKNGPQTPPKQFKYSRRAFDELIRIWRKELHCYDPPDYKGTIDNHKDESDNEK